MPKTLKTIFDKSHLIELIMMKVSKLNKPKSIRKRHSRRKFVKDTSDKENMKSLINIVSHQNE